MSPLPALLRALARPIPLALFLAFATAIPVALAAVLAVQVPLGAVPEGSQRLMVAPVALFLHALSGTLFGLAGPLQFTRALRHRFGWLHRAAGRVFVAAGMVLGASGLAVLAQVSAAPLLEAARAVACTALIAALALGLTARSLNRHRAWMIRAYAIGMGSGTVALVFFPIFAITGTPPSGLAADLVVIGWWALMILLAEAVNRRIDAPA